MSIDIAYIKESPEKKGETQIAFDQNKFEETMKELAKTAKLFDNKQFATYIEQWLKKYSEYLWKLTINLWKVTPDDAVNLVNEINQWLEDAFSSYENREMKAEFDLHDAISLQSPKLAEKVSKVRNNNQWFWDKIWSAIRSALKWSTVWNITKYAEWAKYND